MVTFHPDDHFVTKFQSESNQFVRLRIRRATYAVIFHDVALPSARFEIFSIVLPIIAKNDW